MGIFKVVLHSSNNVKQKLYSIQIWCRCRIHLWLDRLQSRVQVLLEMGGTTSTILAHHGHMAKKPDSQDVIVLRIMKHFSAILSKQFGSKQVKHFVWKKSVFNCFFCCCCIFYTQVYIIQLQFPCVTVSNDSSQVLQRKGGATQILFARHWRGPFPEDGWTTGP